jgi:ribonuclease HI
LAKKTITGCSLERTVRIAGRRKDAADGRAELIVEIDGRSTTTVYGEATHQEAIYVATVKVMRRANADGITDLTIQSANNLVEGQVVKDWRLREPRLATFQRDVIALKDEFDSVTWV